MASTGGDAAAPLPSSAVAPAQGRLIISKMVLENFKSYAGVQEIGPFHTSFSCVVGPNGSGKSNVIDAMLFVYGYRAKKIRMERVSQLIHKSEQHRNLDSARVSVHFAEVDAQGVLIPNTEMVLTRTAHRDDSSKYYLNNKASTFKEVTTLLKQRGIDLDHNRFLILQGEVELISMMKPKATNPNEEGLLNYLEDIIGSNQYIERIEEAGKTLETLNEARGEKLARCKAVEKEKEGLESSKVEAEEYIRKSREIDARQSLVCQVSLHNAKKKAEVAEAARAGVEQQMEAEKERMKETDEQLVELENKYQQETAEHDALAKELQRAKADFAVFERKDIKLREDLKNAVAKEKKIVGTMEKERAKAKETAANVERHRRDIAASEAEIVTLRASATKEEQVLDRIYEGLKETTGPLLVALDAKQKDLLPLRERVDVAKAAVDVVSNEIKLLVKKTTMMETMLEEVRGQTEAARAKHAAGKKEEAALMAREKQLVAEIAALQTRKVELEKQEAALQRAVKERRSRMESAKTNQNDMVARSQVLQGIMGAAKKGKLTGVHGRLGDLGIIDAKYDVAISTACGMLDHILVETTEDGQKCVDYLKATNLGRTTFHMLDKLTANYAAKMDEPVATPENVPRLFDLVKAKEARFRPAFRFALGDTLVAKDLEQATRVAFGGARRYRVVTLDGKLIDASGTMSGGGNKVAKGGMASSFAAVTSSFALAATEAGVVTEKEMSEMVREMEVATQSLKGVVAELEDVRAQLQEKEGELQRVTAEGLPKCRMECTSLEKMMAELAERVVVIKRQHKPDPADEARLAECKEELEQRQRGWEKAKEAAAAEEEQVASIQKQIDEVGGMKLKMQKGKVDALNAQMDTCTSNITKSSVQMKTAEKTLAKCEEAVATMEEEVKKVTEFVTKTKQDLTELETEAGKVMDAYNETKALLDGRAEDLQRAKAEYDRLRTVVEKARGVQVDLENKLEDCSRTARDNSEKVKHYARELVALRKRHEKEIAALGEDVNALDGDSQEELLALEKFFEDLSEEQVAKHNVTEISQQIAVLQDTVASMKPNMGAIKLYKKKAEEYKSRVAELDEATAQRDAARKEHDALRKQRLDDFMAGFSFITLKLKEMYQMITLGGDAELELVDSLDPFSEGIVFSVRPPKKSWKNIQNLSGGEKTLSSLALVFALHQYKPTPLYVMDEIDAALDFKNVSIVANYVKERTKDAQFIIISLRNNMFELADRLVGIYKTDNATKSVTIDPASFVIPSTATSASASAAATSASSSATAEGKAIAV